jgi:NAD(P)-dependent dehydrogenase (short-subunit alcohol dehydrogenase family)
MPNPTALIVGGTSGLGLELAKMLRGNMHVVITGRNDPNERGLEFLKWRLDHAMEHADNLPHILRGVKNVELLVYAAGFFKRGYLTDLSALQIDAIMNVHFTGAVLALRWVLSSQQKLSGFIPITSTSQWVPRRDEPIYSSAKAALAQFARCVALDGQVEKVLLSAPSGMKGRFWDGTDKDTSTMLDQHWVAQEIMREYAEDYKFREIHILREPPRVEHAHTINF